MGFRDLLTKDIKLTSAVFHWREPAWFRVRLKNDLAVRLLMILGAWLGATGVFLVIFASNADPPGIPLAFALGLVGAGLAYCGVLYRSDHASGACWLYRDKLLWQSTSAGFLVLQGNWAEWDYEVIDRCTIVPAEHLHKPFSVMLIRAGGDWLSIGIPKHVELKNVAKLLLDTGVNVSTARALPAAYTSGLAFPAGAAASLGGLGVLGVALVLGRPDAEGEDRQAIVEPDFPNRQTPRNQMEFAEKPTVGGNRSPDPTSDNDLASADNDLASKTSPPFFEPREAGPRPPSPVAGPVGGPGSPAFSAKDTAKRLAQRPPANRAPSMAADESTTTDSELVGGSGGIPFRTINPDGEPIIAVQYAMGRWAGKEYVGRLVPRLASAPTRPAPNLIAARDGYALGAMEIDAGELVDAVRLIFMRIQDDRSLDAHDAYSSEWIGTPSGNGSQRISGDGAPAIGFHGRRAAVLDAIGMVFPSSSP